MDPVNNAKSGVDDPSDNSEIEEEDQFNEEEQRADAEQSEVEKKSKDDEKRSNQATMGLKILVFVILCMTAAGLGVATYVVSAQDEDSDFNNHFVDEGTELLGVAQFNFNRILDTMETLSTGVTSTALFGENAWPNVTVGHFAQKAADARSLTNLTMLVMAPFVVDALGWSAYSQENQAWVMEGLEFQGSNATPKNIPLYIHDSSGQPQVPQSQYLPTWQMSDVPADTSIVNYDLLDNTMMEQVVSVSKAARMTSVSKTIDLEEVFGPNYQGAPGNPVSLITQPVYSSFASTSAVAAYFIAAISWETIFMTDGLHQLLVVLKDTCGDEQSYRVGQGAISYKGPGDLHQSSYSDMKQSIVLSTRLASDGINSCNFTADVYPTQSMEDTFDSGKPIIYSVVVVVVLFGTAVFFIFYEFLVQRRQRKIMAAVRKTTAIVSSIFPANVRQRMLQEEENETQKKQQERVIGGKQGLKNFLDGETANLSDIPYGESKPIADLFPNTTVLFADIAGFTAWSSVREPSQVFTLLETVFQNFDDIAKKRGVFKVETVGDSYVAVTGLPEPRKDHAVVMARFARDCLQRMNELTKKLEVTLGPDTGELACRFGLHSGPCTAGVLRGERARFQLFGDTMNTAARMESTGQRNKIHLSQETAELLKEAGKEHWVELRKDIVVAKGKGALQTYWLHPDSRAREVAVAAAEAAAQESKTPAEKAAELKEDETTKKERLAKQMKEERLIDWNCELLLKLLKAIVARRSKGDSRRSSAKATTSRTRSVIVLKTAERQFGEAGSALSEIKEIIQLPNYVEKREANDIDLGEDIPKQLRQYVAMLASMYRDNKFHCFEHASHVTMSVSKLLSRIIAPDLDSAGNEDIDSALHDHTYGITSDPLTQFAVVLSALIHDVDHRGVPNFILANEEPGLAAIYKTKSIAEQNSIDLAWRALMDSGFEGLRHSIYADEAELKRFRSLVVNSVMATDIFDKELGQLRKIRWDKAFHSEGADEKTMDVINRKATIVIEHLIQASDVSHTMQHWHIYQKWNQRLLEEMYDAYQSKRCDSDPTDNWYDGELGFFDHYIIPLAKKLKDCGVFGVASDEYLNYAMENRREWAKKGQRVVETFKEKAAKVAAAAAEAAAPKAPPVPVPEQAPEQAPVRAN